MDRSPNLGVKQLDRDEKVRIGWLLELGWTASQIAEHEGRSVSAVNRWKKRKSEDLEMTRKAGSGKKLKLSHVEQRDIIRYV